MQRSQLYLTERQREALARRADTGVSVAEAVRRILDRALGIQGATPGVRSLTSS